MSSTSIKSGKYSRGVNAINYYDERDADGAITDWHTIWKVE